MCMYNSGIRKTTFKMLSEGSSRDKTFSVTCSIKTVFSPKSFFLIVIFLGGKKIDINLKGHCLNFASHYCYKKTSEI